MTYDDWKTDVANRDGSAPCDETFRDPEPPERYKTALLAIKKTCRTIGQARDAAHQSITNRR